MAVWLVWLRGNNNKYWKEAAVVIAGISFGPFDVGLNLSRHDSFRARTIVEVGTNTVTETEYGLQRSDT